MTPGFPIDVHISEPGWAELLDAPEAFVARAVGAAVAVLDAPPGGELSVALVSDWEIAELNARFRHKDGPTNVLSFPSGDSAPVQGGVQGDVVVALQTLLREAGTRGIPATDHAAHLLVHGFLHLHGYDHMVAADARVMEDAERAALSSLDVPDPYISRQPSRARPRP